MGWGSTLVSILKGRNVMGSKSAYHRFEINVCCKQTRVGRLQLALSVLQTSLAKQNLLAGKGVGIFFVMCFWQNDVTNKHTLLHILFNFKLDQCPVYTLNEIFVCAYCFKTLTLRTVAI